MTGPLGSVFGGESWAPWRAVLKAAFALALTEDERAIVRELTQRDVLPPSQVRELWLLLGRRSGKSIVAALMAVWSTCCRTYTLAAGEVGVFVVVAADKRQARIIKRYISGLLRAHPALEALVDHETVEAIWLTSGLCVEIHACSWRSLRGYTCIGAAVDEVAFWDSEGANPDHEVLVALRAAMASVPEAMLIGLTSVYARLGEPWRMYQRHFGRDESATVLVVNGPTARMNPLIDSAVIAAAYEDDAVAADAEYGAVFRKDVESLLSHELVAEAIAQGRDAWPTAGARYAWFFDGASGSAAGGDAAAHAIAHRDRGGRVVVDLVECVWPPFDPATVVQRFVAAARRYPVRAVTGDAWAGEWPRAAFQACGVKYTAAERPKGELYRELLPLFSSRRLAIPDDAQLTKQLLGLERRTSRSGREIIDHGAYRGAHDDVANVVAGVAFELRDAARKKLGAASILPDGRILTEHGGFSTGRGAMGMSGTMQAALDARARRDEDARQQERELARALARRREQEEADELRQLVQQYGAHAVETLIGRDRPGFVLAPELRRVGRDAQ